MRTDLNSPPLLVVAAALTDAAGRILLQRRRKDAEHGGLWEFPGGKVDPGEHPRMALARELAEELAIVVNESTFQPLGFATSLLPARRSIVLLLFRCSHWSGDPQCLDADEIAWVRPQDMAELAMPPLDIDLVRDALGMNSSRLTI